MKNFIYIAVLLAFAQLAYCQTPIDNVTTLKNVSPAAQGTTLTTTIMNNGTIGAAPWGFGAGTAAVMTVGIHHPECSLPLTISVAGKVYPPATPSQSIAYNNATNFTWWDSDPPTSTKTKYSWGACLTLGAINTATNLFDLIRTDGQSGSAATFQLQNKTCLNMEINSPSTQHSACITVTDATQSLWCTGFVDSVNGLAKAACYLPTYPYTQVGTTVQISFNNRGNLQTTRVGNGEVGTASGTTNFFENIIFDYTNATFPLLPDFVPPWAGIIAPTRAIDWRNAGFTGGIPVRPRCTIGSGTSVIPVGDSLTTTINNAISSCDANHAVELGVGTLTNLGMLRLANDVELRGQGASQTHLQFATSGGCNGQPALICWLGDNTDKSNPRNLTNWTAGYFPGSTSITLAGPLTNLTIGKSIILDQADDATDLGGIVVSDTASSMTATSPGVAGPRSLEENGGGSQRSGRQQQQEVTVTGCNGSTTVGATCSGSNQVITISPGLYMPNWDASKTPQAWWATTQHHGGGLRNLSVDSGSVANSAIPLKMLNVTQTYIDGVRSIEAARAHVQVQFGSHVTVQNSFFYYSNDSTSSSITKYGVECYGGSDMLVLNNIFESVPGPRPENSACEGNVTILNYFTNIYFSQSAGWNNAFGNDHTAGNEFNLVELNVGNTWDADVFHGTHHFNTFFRNRVAGTQPVCQNVNNQSSYFTATYGACNNNRIGIQLRSWSRFFNLVGNVIGTSGTNTTYQGTAGDRTIFTLNDGNSNGTVTVPDDPNVSTTLLRWGNWDVVNNANRFQSSEVPLSLSATSQSPYTNFNPTVGNTGQPALPASLYYPTKPSWWPLTKAWPPIGPDVTGGNIAGAGGHAFTIPAQDCATLIGINANGTNTTAAAFDPNVCYSGATTSPDTSFSQTSLSFGNQLVLSSANLPTTLTNTGTSTLNIVSVTVSGADFSLNSTTCGATLIVGDSCTITAAFMPSSTGAKSGNILVADDAPGSPQSVSLTGTGTVNRVISHTVGGGRIVH